MITEAHGFYYDAASGQWHAAEMIVNPVVVFGIYFGILVALLVFHWLIKGVKLIHAYYGNVNSKPVSKRDANGNFGGGRSVSFSDTSTTTSGADCGARREGE